MKILVQDVLVETQDIAGIYEIEHDKTSFRNREAGFKITFISQPPLIFKEHIPYESYPNEIKEKKEKWAALQQKVYNKWQADKHNYETFKL